MCVFRYIYLEREHYIIDGLNVGEFRHDLAYLFAKEELEYMREKADCVVPIPRTGITYGKAIAGALNIPYVEAVIKNSLTKCLCFEDKELRKKFLERNLFVIEDQVCNKKILLTDEAVLTGTTIRHTVKLLQEAGAAEIFIAIPTPVCNCRCNEGIMPHLDPVFEAKSIKEYADELGVTEIRHIDGQLFSRFLEEKQISACTECFECPKLDRSYKSGIV